MAKDKMQDKAFAQTMRVLLVCTSVAHVLAVGVMLLSLNLCMSTTVGTAPKLLYLLVNVFALWFFSDIVGTVAKLRLFIVSKRRYPVDKDELILFLKEDKASR